MSKSSDLVQGTSDMLLLKILVLEPMNGFAVSQRLEQGSGDVLHVSDGSPYRLCISWSKRAGLQPSGRHPCMDGGRNNYSLTRLGRGQLEKEADHWGWLSSAISRVIRLKEV